MAVNNQLKDVIKQVRELRVKLETIEREYKAEYYNSISFIEELNNLVHEQESGGYEIPRHRLVDIMKKHNFLRKDEQ